MDAGAEGIRQIHGEAGSDGVDADGSGGRRVGNTESGGGWHEALTGRGGYADRSEQDDGGLADANNRAPRQREPGKESGRRELQVGGFGSWSDSLLIPCADNKWRRVPGRRVADSERGGRREDGELGKLHEIHQRGADIGVQVEGAGSGGGEHKGLKIEPALFPLADGISNRVGLLRGAGNAICPEVAAVFIQCADEAMKGG